MSFTLSSESEAGPATSGFTLSEEPEETGLKYAARTAAQVPLGLLKRKTWQADLAKEASLGASRGALMDLAESDWINQRSNAQHPSIDVPQAMERATELTDKYFPTQDTAERAIEGLTGAPLTAKTSEQEALRYASEIAGFRSGGKIQKSVSGGIGLATKEGLIALGAPEWAANLAGFVAGQATPLPKDIGKATKSSGLPTRRYESVNKPTRVTPERADIIKDTVEQDFRKIADKLLKKNQTYSEIKNNPNFKEETSEAFQKLRTLSHEVPGEVKPNAMGQAFRKRYRDLVKEQRGFITNEFEDTLAGEASKISNKLNSISGKKLYANDLEQQYRKTNESLTELFQPGKSSAENRARKEALLELNRSIVDVIEKRWPGSQFAEPFKALNDKWSKLMATEQVDSYIDDIFSGKIDYNKAKKLMDSEYLQRPFEKLVGKEGLKDIKQLFSDLMTTQQGMRQIRKAAESGFGTLARTAAAYAVHPYFAAAKEGYKYAKLAYQMLLDKPRLAVTWENGIQAFKRGAWAEAEKDFDRIQAEAKAYEASHPEVQEATKSGSGSNKKPDTVDISPKGIEYKPKQIEGPSGPKQVTHQKPPEKPKPPKPSMEEQAQKAKEFRTKKGSIYEVNEDNTTTRNKAERPEHGPNEKGLQPKSEKTWYVSSKDAEKLGEIQAQGGPSRKVYEFPNGDLGIMYTSGPHKGMIEARTVVTPKVEPGIGLTPVESWQSGEQIHFGNEIVEVGPAKHNGKPAKPEAKHKTQERTVKQNVVNVEVEAPKPKEKAISPKASEPTTDQLNIKRLEQEKQQQQRRLEIAETPQQKEAIQGRIDNLNSQIKTHGGKINPDEAIPKELFRGHGRATKESVYNTSLGGEVQPVLGEGKYYAFDEKVAAEFGPKIEKKQLDLKNPLIIRSDNDWRAYARKSGWEFPNTFGLPKEQIAKHTKQFQEQLLKDGHDGAVIFWDNTAKADVDKFGNSIKTLRNVFAEPQVFIPNAKVEPTKPAKPTKEVAKQKAKERAQPNTAPTSTVQQRTEKAYGDAEYENMKAKSIADMTPSKSERGVSSNHRPAKQIPSPYRATIAERQKALAAKEKPTKEIAKERAKERAKPRQAASNEAGEVQHIPMKEIAIKPDLMQFKKIDIGSTGENKAEVIEGVWDHYKSGNILLWEPKNPSSHGLTGDQKYIVANGHHRHAFAQREGVKSYNAQIVKESEGITANDAMRLGAEINIAEGKGTIYDQTKYLRDIRRTLGEAESATAAKRTGKRGERANSIATYAEDDLYNAFINERITPEQAEAIANTTKNQSQLQQLGLDQALKGKPPREISNFIKAIESSFNGKKPYHEQLDLFGKSDSALQKMEKMSKLAMSIQNDISADINSITGASKSPERARKLGVDVKDSIQVDAALKQLRAKARLWEQWHLHPELVKEVTSKL